MTAFRLALLIALLSPTAALSAGLAQNENFIVLTPAKPSQEEGKRYAQLVLKNAAKFRAQFSKDWLGEELPPGTGRTIISVQFSGVENSGLTWARDDASRRFHNVYLTTTAENGAGTMLRHEVAHTVLATKYPHPNRLPPWAEEGIASRYDRESLKDVRRSAVAAWLKSGRIPSLAQLLATENIESYDGDQYAAAESLVSYLLTLKDQREVCRFAESCQRDGWDDALWTHYQIDSLEQLQRDWGSWLAESN
jgi:hypothetical protein